MTVIVRKVKIGWSELGWIWEQSWRFGEREATLQNNNESLYIVLFFKIDFIGGDIG